MPHNLAIIMPGALEEIGQAAEKMSADPDVEGRLYVPASSKLLYATKLIAPGQKGQLTFDAPKEVGDYPFVCTFPGHWRRMTGILAVVKDVDEYVASHAQAATPKFTDWKLADFVADLSTNRPVHDSEEGREFFTKLACVQCQKLGSQGYSYGPDLTDVFARYTNDRPAVLQQILEPSKTIADRYRNFRFELKSGEPVLGLVLKEDGENVTVQTGPADSLIQNLKISEIVHRTPQESSPMPLGLLNSLSKDQVFSLLSYLETGGKDTPHEHRH
jgi:putative heme-binding domain-containing protein